MINFYEGSLLDIVPENLKTDEVKALSFSLQKAMQMFQDFSKAAAVHAAVPELPDCVLDLLAVELRTQYYDRKLPREVREKLIMDTIAWYMHAGTPSVIEEFLGTLYNGGKVTEWFDYGGEPYCFRSEIDVTGCETTLGEALEIKKRINLYKNVRSWLEAVIYNIYSEFHVDVRYENGLTIETGFYPRYNLPFLYLNNLWDLKGDRYLSGYDSDKQMDFYPVGLSIQSEAEADVKTAVPCICLHDSVLLETDISSGLLFQTEAGPEIQTEEQISVQTEAGYGIATDSYMTKLNVMDGSWQLDGSRKLDGGVYIL